MTTTTRPARPLYTYAKRYVSGNHIGAPTGENVETLCGMSFDADWVRKEAYATRGLCRRCYNAWNKVTGYGEHSHLIHSDKHPKRALLLKLETVS